jgi:hypothetical protein
MVELNLPQIITAIGGLGTAAFGLVDATKAFWGGANHLGFHGIRKTVIDLTPGTPGQGFNQEKIVQTLKANWMNGTDLASQKSIAKSLIKLYMNQSNVSDLAKVTGVDSGTFSDIAKCFASGTPLSSSQSDVYARFDLILTTMLDEAYQRADQAYRNATRGIAAAVAIVLALIGGLILENGAVFTLRDIFASLIVGLLATPLAPVAKDLSSALASAVNTLQLVKK